MTQQTTPPAVRLDPPRLRELLAGLPGWRHGDERGGTLTREFRFDGFAQAFAFMTQVAIGAEKRDHHPEWRNVYDRVEIVLTTHDADGVSMRDIELARVIDAAYSAHAAMRPAR